MGRPAHFVSDRLARRVRDIHGAPGAEWLGRLRETIAACEQRWSLKVLAPFKAQSYNYVAPAVRTEGTAVVLKLGVPTYELSMEVEAMRLYDGRGAAGLLEADAELGAMVLERLRPGLPLSSVRDDEQATFMAAQVMGRLRRPAPSDRSFPTVTGWAAGLERLRARFDGGTGPLPAPLVQRAEALFVELLGSMGEPVLLHGDLHHGNILSAERESWLAVDPKGVVGEAECEVGPFLREGLLRQPKPERALARRVEQLAAELGFERERVAGWGLAQAVLSAWWHCEDHGHMPEETLACAELFAQL